jgi:hypothetical protein
MAGRVAYYGGIVKDGLVLNLDAAKRDSYPGTGTTWRDISGNQRNGTLTNGPTFNSANGGSIVFDGVNDYVVTPTVSLNSFGLTMNMWFKYTPLSAIRFLLDFRGITPDNTLSIYITPQNKLILDDRDGPVVPGGDISAIESLSSISSNTWIYLSATVNRSLGAGNEDTFYINGGRFASSYVYSDNLNTAYASNPFYIGNISGSGFPYKGDISLVQVYNRALTAQEVLQNYNATKGRYGL